MFDKSRFLARNRHVPLPLWASSIAEVWLLLGLRAGAGVRERVCAPAGAC